MARSQRAKFSGTGRLFVNHPVTLSRRTPSTYEFHFDGSINDVFNPSTGARILGGSSFDTHDTVIVGLADLMRGAGSRMGR